ncbi:ABC1 kinase family protein [Flavisphingomonas formosensis]|uniref:ABC1 kinase family protein n=1 Tax=Flavisphingomonas formosensis TaxID=861534 RepID=UPI0012F83FBB|nr:AarF/UbiB family protein [Sphingomonas formosensis]
MIKTLLVAARDRDRLGEIGAVAARYGLGALLARLGLSNGDEGEGSAAGTLPERTRRAIEELGPTFVKLGQILATRRDLLSDEWIEELERLHSQAPTLPFEMLREAVEAALGQPPEQAFASFDPAPLAAASMAQVHRATLKDGRAVVLKIRRPGIGRRMEADLRLIAHLAEMAERTSAEARRFAPGALVRQLAQAVLEELDFTHEGRNADRLAADFAKDARVVVPAIHWGFSSPGLLVMDYVAGVAPRNGEALRAAGIDPQAIADLGADLVLDMVLLNGRFHGDPHPGNLLCLTGNRLALLDLGLIGHVSPRRREEFLRFIHAIRAGDPAALADTLAVWSGGAGTSHERILAASERLVARHSGGRLVLSALVRDFFPLLREQGMMLPPDLLLIFKAMITMDGVLVAIQPDFDLTASIERARLRILMERLSPDRWSAKLDALALELARIGDDAPRLIRVLVNRLETEPAADRAGAPSADAIVHAGKWVAGAIVMAGLLIAGALFLG